MKRRQWFILQGFTLIELLIVIAVLGILIALILPRFADLRKEVYAKTCVANLRAIAATMAVYEERYNRDVNWDVITCTELVEWGFLAAEPFCPLEPLTPGAEKQPYELVDDESSPFHINHALCPNAH